MQTKLTVLYPLTCATYQPLLLPIVTTLLQVAQTCQLAVQRIAYLAGQTSEANARYSTVDPAPPADPSTSLADLQATLADEHAPIFQRYRAMFAVAALGQSLQGNRALLKHEVAYVLGQMADTAAVEYLRWVTHNFSVCLLFR